MLMEVNKRTTNLLDRRHKQIDQGKNEPNRAKQQTNN